MREVAISSASRAGDLGLQSLADLCDAACDLDYRVVGGHMVQLLCAAYPTPGTDARVTIDADAGIEPAIAAGHELHSRLLDRGYQLAGYGNHYEAKSGNQSEPHVIELLVPSPTEKTVTESHGERAFDAIPGLRLALSAAPLQIRVHVMLTTREERVFVARVPDVEAAVVLKTQAWHNRSAAKDMTDLCSLMLIVHQHRDALTVWKLTEQTQGARNDATRVLHTILTMIDRDQWIEGLTIPAAQLGALIRRYVHPSGSHSAPKH